MKPLRLIATLSAFAAVQLHAGDPTTTAANAVNALGIDLLAKTGKPGENALLSPYSIQDALAMAYAGADGKTREEMAKALHYPKDDAELNASFAALEKVLATIHDTTLQAATPDKERPWVAEGREPVTFTMANRLFAQSGMQFQKPFLDLLTDNYNAPLEQLDFITDPDKAKDHINGWVAEQTLKRIQDLIPDQTLTKNTRFVLVNAIYMKAQWQHSFRADLTKPAPFHVNGGDAVNVPMLVGYEMRFGGAKRDGYTVVTMPYTGYGLQFVLLLPDKRNGLAALEAKLTPEMLAECVKFDHGMVDITMPKLKLEPPVMELTRQLQALGMKSAFDPAKADFSRIAPGGLFISDVFHKTCLSLDEKGTEAAAATSVSGALSDGDVPDKVTVDHPFIFAIQDRKSGACLFIGRVTDPR